MPGAGAGAGQTQPSIQVPGACGALILRVPAPVPVRVPGTDRQPAPASRGMIKSYENLNDF